MEDSNSIETREMYMSDLSPVLKIIEALDEDDAEAAHEDYAAAGVEGQFVTELAGNVIGVSGYREVEATDKTFWLSWTYLSEAQRGQGIGKRMVNHVLDTLRADGGRKIFIKVSDYNDPEDGEVYKSALMMYQSLGFEIELTNTDFYDDGENQLILGLELGPTDADANQNIEIVDEKPTIRFNGLFEIAETDGAYTFSWNVPEKAAIFGNRCFSVEDLKLGLKSAQEEGGRRVFLTFPGNLPLIHKPLQAAGFKLVGKLKDYYEQGLDELHFVYDLTNL